MTNTLRPACLFPRLYVCSADHAGRLQHTKQKLIIVTKVPTGALVVRPASQGAGPLVRRPRAIVDKPTPQDRLHQAAGKPWASSKRKGSLPVGLFLSSASQKKAMRAEKRQGPKILLAIKSTKTCTPYTSTIFTSPGMSEKKSSFCPVRLHKS